MDYCQTPKQTCDVNLSAVMVISTLNQCYGGHRPQLLSALYSFYLSIWQTSRCPCHGKNGVLHTGLFHTGSVSQKPCCRTFAASSHSYVLTYFVVIEFEHMKHPAKLLDCFLRSNKSNINQLRDSVWNHDQVIDYKDTGESNDVWLAIFRVSSVSHCFKYTSFIIQDEKEYENPKSWQNIGDFLPVSCLHVT